MVEIKSNLLRMHLQRRKRIAFGGLVYKRKPFPEENPEEWWIPNKAIVGLRQ